MIDPSLQKKKKSTKRLRGNKSQAHYGHVNHSNEIGIFQNNYGAENLGESITNIEVANP